MGKYIFGTLIIGVGVLIMWKADWILDNFGRVAWAEEKLGMEGGSRLFYRLIGLVFIVGSFLYMSGLLGSILKWVFGGGSSAPQVE